MLSVTAVNSARPKQGRFATPFSRPVPYVKTHPSMPLSTSSSSEQKWSAPYPHDPFTRVTSVSAVQAEKANASRQLVEALRDIRVAQVMYNPALLKTVAPEVTAKFNAMAKLAKQHPLSPVELSKDPLAMASTSAALAERLNQLAKDPAHKTNKGLFELGSLALVDSTRTYLAIAGQNTQSFSKLLSFAGNDQKDPPTDPISVVTGPIGTVLNFISGPLLAFIIHHVGKPKLLENAEDRTTYSRYIGYTSGALAGTLSTLWITGTAGMDVIGLADGILLTPITAASSQILGKYVYGVDTWKELNTMSKLAIQAGVSIGGRVALLNGAGAEIGLSFLADATLRPAMTAILHHSNAVAWNQAFEARLLARKEIVIDKDLTQLYNTYYSNVFTKIKEKLFSYPKAILDWFRGKRKGTSEVTAEFLGDAQNQFEKTGLSVALETTHMAINDVLQDGVVSTTGNYAMAPMFNMMGLQPIQRTPLQALHDQRRDYDDWFRIRSHRYINDIHAEYNTAGKELSELLT